ncbi:hypothetical protein GJ496_005541 [Pomphorhynchus laevis]|nr:hypothetical protein GJ496_005541 [Pomphorhynchus laevis]
MSTSSEANLDQIGNLNNGENKLLLVKVPKYLAEGWSDAANNGITDIGTIAVADENFLNLHGEGIEAHYELGRSIANVGNLPVKHTLHLRRRLGAAGFKPYIIESNITGHNVLGHIAYKGDLKPADINDKRYVELKRKAHVQANKPNRTICVLDNHHQAYKPKASHHRNIEFEADKKLTNGLKRERASKDVVMQTVLSAFEKHPFLNIRDLCRITNQPVPFLKEILKELCQYNSKPPNKFTYELKPEYRHYPSK